MRTISFIPTTGFRGTSLPAAFLGLLFLGPGTPGGYAQNINAGIIDPTNTYAGQTYSEWAAGWWQHYMSLPATNNPFNQYGKLNNFRTVSRIGAPNCGAPRLKPAV